MVEVLIEEMVGSNR